MMITSPLPIASMRSPLCYQHARIFAPDADAGRVRCHLYGAFQSAHVFKMRIENNAVHPN